MSTQPATNRSPALGRRKRVTLADVARRAGVSQTAASFVLTGRREEMRISADVEARVLQAAQETGLPAEHRLTKPPHRDDAHDRVHLRHDRHNPVRRRPHQGRARSSARPRLSAAHRRDRRRSHARAATTRSNDRPPSRRNRPRVDVHAQAGGSEPLEDPSRCSSERRSGATRTSHLSHSRRSRGRTSGSENPDRSWTRGRHLPRRSRTATKPRATTRRGTSCRRATAGDQREPSRGWAQSLRRDCLRGVAT